MNGFDRSSRALQRVITMSFGLFLALAPLPLSAEPAPETGPTETAAEAPAGQDRTGQGMITPGQTLTLNQCIDIALKKNPNIVAAVNNVGANKSRVGQARSDYYPQLSATAGYSRTAPIAGTTASTLGPRYDQYSAGVTLNQNFLDFKTSPTVDAAKYNLDSARARLTDTENTTVLTVKQAYYGLLQARRNSNVAADVINQFQLHLDQAKGFYEVGTRARIDVIKAEVDLSNAKLSLINAENALKIAQVNLNNAMGIPDAPEYAIEDELPFQSFVITPEEAVAKAFESRPDLKSIIAQRQAAESTVSVARSGYFPVLSGSASYNKAGINEHPSELNDGWQVGATLTVPLFSGFLTNHQVAEAKANLYVLKANEEVLRQQILLEVRQAFLNLQAAEASIATAELAARQAKENLDLANGRYAAGVGSPVEVSDAFATYVSAQANYTSALSNYKLAQASIVRAMGMR